jgi:O-antigen ligase
MTNDLLTFLSSRVVGGLMDIGWGTSNMVAGTLLVSVFCVLAGFLIEKKRVFYGLTTVLASVSILLTLSRTAIILYLLTGCYIAIRLRTKASVLLLLLLVLGGLVVLFHHAGLEVLLSERIGSVSNLSGRADVWVNSLAHISKNLFNPIGYFNSLDTFQVSSHNILLTTFIEQGWFGLFFLLLIVFYPYVFYCSSSRHNKTPIAHLLLFGIFISTANLLFEDLNFIFPFVIMFYILHALFYFSLILEDTKLEHR